jgi:hypothetical protein
LRPEQAEGRGPMYELYSGDIGRLLSGRFKHGRAGLSGSEKYRRTSPLI